MQVPSQISTHSLTLSPAEEKLVRRHVERLERFFPRLIRCGVVINGYSHRHRTGGPVSVRIHLGVPGDELTVDRKKAENVGSGLREAFGAARRQLQDYARVRRGRVKTHEGQPEGRVIRLFHGEGYGFLQAADGREIYFHANSVLSPGFEALRLGSEVRYSEEQGDEGPQASSLVLVGVPTERPLDASTT